MTKKVVLLVTILTILIFGSGILLLKKTLNPVQQSKDIKELIGSARHTKGNDQAKITLVEIADFQCSACVIAYPYIKEVLDSYQNDIYYVYRHFPLPQHRNAFIASEASEAAFEQGRFWEMHNILYEKQPDWKDSLNPIEKFSEYAQELGLNTDQFRKALEEHKFRNVVQKDFDEMVKLGIVATPTFFINGVSFTGEFKDLSSFIESKLK